ncbi:MAG TPA: chorismate synthase [Bacteroidales bacterium]|nr:chorismate synthase [Bacteroidales bacterium]HPR57549.1 chorismate synthase [Bacteroidales bacterium]
MPGNTIGQTLRLTGFGESHGKAVGGILDGYPPGIVVDMDYIQKQLERRRPGKSIGASKRDEPDKIEILSGIYEGKSTGSPIAFLIQNQDSQSGDYDQISRVYRPSHADFVYEKKYGFADLRGGGRASARETVVRVAAGAFASLLLQRLNISIIAYTRQIGELMLPPDYSCFSSDQIESSPVRCPDQKLSEKMIALLEKLKEEGDSTGGIVECQVLGCPAGLGDPVFDKINADLAKAMMSINAAKGFEVGSGFQSVIMTGSQHNDSFYTDEHGNIRTLTNRSGGIQAGITNGEALVFRVAFKPTPSIGKLQKTVDKSGNETSISIAGRHDTCVVPRAVPVVEAMAALVIADHWLRNLSTKYFVNL